MVESFFENFYTISHNGQKLPLKLESSKHLVGHNVIVMRFTANKLKLRKGDNITITNTLFSKISDMHNPTGSQFASLRSQLTTIMSPPSQNTNSP